ncbi:hypothetical protein GQF29_17020 [Coprobacillus cateniformis]|uniref:M15 family metallopeptidase n=1 Tax=Coprobacillus cateniformis TaxID=100884 RepID=UPI0006CFE68C|nr:M15 family metallopeptidase [Coprobacillus cateniformis]MVX29671.1 hypothetical protein [Coprobacillus cateniformis]
MKIKTWHLFFVIIVLFGCSFYIVNLKFDKFYRVNGINNDNRVLIEKYLDKDEQTYLIDNQISIELFIDYLEFDDFHLQNYQYYNYLKESGRYKKTSEILDVANSLVTRLSYLYKDSAMNQAKLLIDRSLEMVFLSEENFRFDYIDLYTDLKPLYASQDYSYIEDAETYVQRFGEMGIDDFDDVKKTMHMMTQAYSKDALADILKKELPHNVQIVYNPNDLSTLVDHNHYIGKYEPTGLLLVQDIPRIRYAIYLQSDAYNALVKMYQDLSKKHSGFLLREGYIGAQSLKADEVGYTEEQLGLTIEVAQSQIPYKDFDNTDISKWLQEHAYEYGFILRYPKEKASITNHTYDPHIYRYVGKGLAKSLHESDLTLEEYQSQNK